MQLANNQFVVLSVNPEIKTEVRKWPACVNGELVLQQDSTQYQQGTATDGTAYDGEKTVFTFDAEPGTVEVGDTISGNIDHHAPTRIHNVFVERGKNAVAPLKFTPKPLPQFDFNQPDPNVEYAAPQGVDLTFEDLIQIVRGLQQRVQVLEQR
jgi:hypothetical protein